MESLKQLIYLSLYLYFGIFTHLTYTTIFYYQKRFRLLKTLGYFFGIAVLWIHISNRYSIPFYPIYPFLYVFGYYLSFRFFQTYLIKIHTQYLKFFHKAKWKLLYWLKLLCIPPFIYTIRCFIYQKLYYHKHPWLKPLTLKRLF